MSVPRKDPATDSTHKITLLSGDTPLDPTIYDGIILVVFRGNGSVLAKFSVNSIPGYTSMDIVDDGGTKKLKILMSGSKTKGINNESIYYKVFTQLAGLKVGPKMEDVKKGYVLFETCESQISELPDMDP